MSDVSAAAGLAGFLLERIAEDEAVVGEDVSRARQIFGSWADLPQMWWERGTLTIAAVRVHAECEAKRRIVELHRREFDLIDDEWSCAECGVALPCPTLRLLALPYVSHPEWHAEWRA